MKLLGLALLPLMLMAFSSSNAQSPEQMISALKGAKRWGSVPITKDHVYFTIPDGFPMTASWDSNTPGLYQAAFFPVGQSKENWKDTLRLMAFQGIPKGNDPPARQMIELLEQPIRAACPNNFVFERKEQRESRRASAIMGCRKLGGSPPMAVFGYYLAIQGEESMYVLAREFRQSPFEGDLPVSKSIQGQWQAQVDRTTICRRNEVCIKLSDR